MQHVARAALKIGEAPHHHNCKVVRERLGEDASANNRGFIATPTGAATELSYFEKRSTPPRAEELEYRASAPPIVRFAAEPVFVQDSG
jgi:hypothetical protein